jgi:hypothetical protein
VVIVILAILGLAGIGFAVFLWVLLSTHIVLISTNQTTAEYLKNSKGDHPANPFKEYDNKLCDEKCQKVLYITQEKESHDIPNSSPKPNSD